jgi:ABC-type nitrate/sulfonate/bicarbonate transport system permease component
MTNLRASGLERYAGAVGVLLFLAAWEIAARLVWRDPQVLPAPSQALIASLTLLTPGQLMGHVGASLFRIAAGFAMAAVAGIGLGILVGWSPKLNAVLRPFVELLRPIPPLAWIPIAIIWFGLGETSKVFVIFLGAIFPIFTSAWRGVTMIPPVLISAARSMDVDGARLLWKVAVPASLPDIATGLRVGFGLSFGILVAAELIAAEQGMGYLVMEARQLGHLGVSIFGIVLIGLVNLLADYQLAAATRWTIGRWAQI